MAPETRDPAPGIASRTEPDKSKGAGQRHHIEQDSEQTAGFQPEPPASATGSYRHCTSKHGGGHQLKLALFYASAGHCVVPVCPRTKRPLTPHGFKDATTNVARIVEWWTLHPDALVAFPTGSRTGFWVLDIDPPAGVASLRDLLALLGLDDITDLSPVIVQTPSGGWHIWFALRPGEEPRTRASDIGPGLDTRGEGGYIIAPGNMLPDGRCYRHLGRSHDIADASPAPLDLIYLATFGDRERDTIADDAELSRAIRGAKPADWPGIREAHRARERAAMMARLAMFPPDADAMRRQALADLAEAARAVAGLSDGRRNALFVAACRLAKYAAQGVLSEAEVLAALKDAASANGSTAKHGWPWTVGTIQRGLDYGANDPLPPLARRFREGRA